MSDRDLVTISKVTEATAFINANPTICEELTNFFSVYAPNYRWAPAYKQGHWDGKIRFFDYQNHLPIGLVSKVADFCRLGRYTFKTTFDIETTIDRTEFQRFVDSLNIVNGEGEPMEPRDYQFNSAYEACFRRHICMEVPTAGGKTLIAYIIARFFEKIGKRLLIVVPNVSLVEQSYTDFFSYGWEDLSQYVHMIYAGKKKDSYCPIIISTWQSLQPKIKDHPEYFEQFDGILIDEAHGAKATVLKDLTKACVNAQWRLGLSGTYPDAKTADWYTIVGSLGPIKKFTTYKELQEKGHIAGLKIYTIILKYPLRVKRECYIKAGDDYQAQNDFIYGLKSRNEFIRKMVAQLDKNTLVLFTKIEKHGEPLRDTLRVIPNRKLQYIVGGTQVSEREMARAIAERRDDVIILASYGVFSTGINVKNIHFILFASGYKSKIKVLQSIGRGLRKHKDKVDLVLYDIVDDMSFTSKKEDIRFINHAVKHFKDRLKIYADQGFTHKYIEYQIKDDDPDKTDLTEI